MVVKLGSSESQVLKDIRKYIAVVQEGMWGAIEQE